MPIKRERPPVSFADYPPGGGTKGVILLPEVLGLEIRRHRGAAGLLQMGLAARLNWPQSRVSRMERGDARLGIDQLYAVVYAINAARFEQGDDPLKVHEILERVNDLGQQLVPLDYELVWSAGPEWPDPTRLIRGQTLMHVLGLIDTAYPP